MAAQYNIESKIEIQNRLLPVNLLSRHSTFPPSKNGLFQFPAPTSGTVFHHTLHAPVARDIPAASQDISFPPVISGSDSLTLVLPHCGPCDIFVI